MKFWESIEHEGAQYILLEKDLLIQHHECSRCHRNAQELFEIQE